MAGDQHSGETSFVPIDIGKAFHAVLVELPDGVHQRFRMANSAEDYGRLVAFLRTLPGRVRVALEPTGNFHRTLAFRLLTEGISVVSASSVAGARYREAMFNSWDRNDPKDVMVILQLLKHGGPALSRTVARRAPRPTRDGEDLSSGDTGAQTPGR